MKRPVLGSMALMALSSLPAAGCARLAVQASATLVGTNADKAFCSSPKHGKELGEAGLGLAVQYNF